MERLQALAEASSSQPRYTPNYATYPPPMTTTAPRKRRPITFSDEDKRIVVRSIADMAKTDREGSSFGALWKNLAQQYPRHSAHAWRSCWKEINEAEANGGPPKKLKAPFSPEDEEALIEFLAAGGPKPNLSWKDFAVEHPERRVEAWQMYSYRNRDRLIDRIRQRRLEISPNAAEDDLLSEPDPSSSRSRNRPRRSGVHFNEADRKVLEDALEAIPNPRDARALTRLWTQLETEHPERSAQSWKKCYMKFRDEIGQGASRTSPRRPGRYGAAYTEAEEDALIVFLAGKKEPDASWADFTKSNPGRTKEAWRQHWYGNRERLLKRAQALGLEVSEEGSIFSESFRVGRSAAASAHAAARQASLATVKPALDPKSEGDDDGPENDEEVWSTDDEDEEHFEPNSPHDNVFIVQKSEPGPIPTSSEPAPPRALEHLDLSSFRNYPTPSPFFNVSPRGGKRRLTDVASASSPFITIGNDEPPASTLEQPSSQSQQRSTFSSRNGSPQSTVGSVSTTADTDPAIREPPQKRKKNLAGGAVRVTSPLATTSPSDPDMEMKDEHVEAPTVTDTVMDQQSILSSKETAIIDFTVDDRSKVTSLIADAGPHPPPGTLLRFAEENKSHTLEDWLQLLESCKASNASR